jgi:predicted MFS family arabinose efflux permease
VKPLVLIALCISSGGNLLYAFARSRYLVLVARLLDGVAAGSMASVISFLTRATTLAERTPTVSNYWGISMISVIVSPGAFVRVL